MAIHDNLSSLAQEAIEEYLTTTEFCLGHKKQDGGCLGYPSALLMLCLINAFGCFLRNESVVIDSRTQRITKGEPFRVLNHQLFNCGLSNEQIKAVEHRYRNLLSHNAMLAPNSWLVPGSGQRALSFSDKTVVIDVHKLYNLVKTAWQQLDKAKIQHVLQMGYIRVPQA